MTLYLSLFSSIYKCLHQIRENRAMFYLPIPNMAQCKAVLCERHVAFQIFRRCHAPLNYCYQSMNQSIKLLSCLNPQLTKAQRRTDRFVG